MMMLGMVFGLFLILDRASLAYSDRERIQTQGERRERERGLLTEQCTILLLYSEPWTTGKGRLRKSDIAIFTALHHNG